MKGTMLLAVLTFSVFCSVSFAQQADPSDTTNGGQMQCPGHGMAPGQCMGQGMGACAMMLRPQVIPTSDGGVIVLMGNKMIKYDKNLNRKQEVNIQLSQQEMQTMINQIRDAMSMCRQMMQDTSSQGQGSGGQ